MSSEIAGLISLGATFGTTTNHSSKILGKVGFILCSAVESFIFLFIPDTPKADIRLGLGVSM